MEDFYLYMKKSKLITLPLIALALIGCSRAGTSSASSTSDNSQNSQVSTTTTDSSTTTNDNTTTSEDLTTSVESSTSEDSSTSSVDPYVGWDSKTLTLMQKHLGGNVLPYYDLKGSITADWVTTYNDYGTFVVSGTKKWDKETTTNELAIVFSEANGYTITSNSNGSFSAEHSSGKLHVTAAPSSDDEKYIEIKATYDEDFDIEHAVSDWEDDLKTDMEDAFGEALPYVYLGMNYPYYEPVSATQYSSAYITVSGGKWVDGCLDQIKTYIEGKNFTDIELNSSSNTMTAHKKFTSSDNDFFITIEKTDSSYGSSPKIRMIIQKKEAYNPSSYSKWDDDIVDEFNSYFHNHGSQVPFVYLGTTTPRIDANDFTSSQTLDIIGDAWNDAILTTAKSTFEANENCSNTYLSNGTVTTTYAIPDSCGCSMTIKVFKYSNYASQYPKMEITFKKGFIIPTGDSAKWDTKTQEIIDTYFNGFNLPFIYLSDDQTSSYDTANSTLTVTGGEWNDKISDNAMNVLSSWTNEDNDSYGVVFEKTYTVTSGDNIGDKFIFTLMKTYQPPKGYIPSFTVQYLKKYKATNAVRGSYTEATQKLFTNYIHGHEIPYVYLGLEDENSQKAIENNADVVKIYGAYFDDDMLTEAESKFKAAAWTTEVTTDKKDNKTFSASKTMDNDGCLIEVTITKDTGYEYTNHAVMTVSMNETYKAENKQEDWNDSTKKIFSEHYSGVTIPYVYLGTTKEKSGYYAYSPDYASIKGGKWNNAILSEAKSAFEEKGWTVIEGNYTNGGKGLFMCQEDTTNNLFYSVILYSNDGVPTMNVYKESTSGESHSTLSDYTPSDKAKIEKYNGGYSFPFIDMGVDSLQISSGDSYFSLYAYNSACSIKHRYDVYKQFKALNNDEYNVQIQVNSNDISITGVKTHEDGTKTKFSYSGSTYNHSLNLTYLPAFKQDENVTDWSPKVKNIMTTNFDGNYVPYFYFGSNAPSYNYYSSMNEISLYGEVWDDAIYTNCETALKADTAGTWNIIYSYSGSKKLIATKECATGVITVEVYKSSEQPTVNIYFYSK